MNKREKLQSIFNFTKWEEIEIGQIYCIPQIDDVVKRALIKVTYKSTFFVVCEDLLNRSSTESRYIYSSQPCSKFLVLTHM